MIRDALQKDLSQAPADGMVIVNKPPDMSSAKVVAKIKKMLGAKKAGHTGTLDPFATGVLACCLGKATKLSRFFLHGDKAYEATMILGVETDTQDLTGKVVATTGIGGIDEESIREAFSGFLGEIQQAPPVYSALKHNGVPLYKLARKGKPVQKPPRNVTIHELAILEMDLPKVRFATRCSGGTYIRSLCADIGTTLGCGAHLHTLCRTQSSGFGINQAMELSFIADMCQQNKAAECVVPMADALPQMPEYEAAEPAMKKIRYGQRLLWKDLKGSDHDAKASCMTASAADSGVFEKSTPEGGTVCPESKIKIVDSDRALLAVAEPRADGVGLDYVCVFCAQS